MRGKIERNKPSRVDMGKYVKIIKYFYKLHRFVTITTNVMFVNFFSMITSVRNLTFVTVCSNKFVTSR